MSSILYSKEHVWVRPGTDGMTALAGISDYAASQMEGIVYADLGISQRVVKSGDEMGVVESTKAAASIVCPFDCRITAVNDISAEVLNERAEELENWLYKVDLDNPRDLDGLMDKEAYRKYLKELGEEDPDEEEEELDEDKTD